MKKALPLAFAFAVGLAAGMWRTMPVAGVGATADEAEVAEGPELDREGESPSVEESSAGQVEDLPRTEPEVVVPPPTVEVVADEAPAPEAEMTAAHAARQARRQAVREARERERHDFLSTLNVDLLTATQRKMHALYVEANETRNALRKEISALRAADREVPAELQSRLADAESVLRADRESERRALREAAARGVGLDETALRQLMEDLVSIDEFL